MAQTTEEIAKELTITVLTKIAPVGSVSEVDPEKMGATVGQLYRAILAKVTAR